jgi:hypothetical protein
MYEKIFDNKVDIDLYVACALLDRHVNEYLDLQFELALEDRRDTKYYVEMWLAATSLKSAAPTPAEIASLTTWCVAGIPEDDLKNAVAVVYKPYKELGGTDTIAKGPELRRKLMESLAFMFPKRYPVKKDVS